jgi:hypothetical protein
MILTTFAVSSSTKAYSHSEMKSVDCLFANDGTRHSLIGRPEVYRVMLAVGVYDHLDLADCRGPMAEMLCDVMKSEGAA